MPLQFQYRSAFDICALTSTDGAAAASLAVQADRRITGDANTVGKIQWVANSSTAAELPMTIVYTSGIGGSLTPTPTYTRPLGSGGYASLEGVHAIEVKVSADPISTAEIENESLDRDRTFTGYLELKNNSDEVIWRWAFEVSEPGEILVGQWMGRSAIYGGEFTLFISASSTKSRIEILTIAETG